MPGWPLRKNEAGTLPVLVFPIYDADGDLVTAAATLDSERSIDQGTFADCTNEAVEIATSSGVYSLAPTQAELNGDEIAFITKTGTAGAKTAVNVIYTSLRNIDDLAFPTVSGQSLDVTATGAAGVDFGNIEGTLDAAEIGTGAITAVKFGAGAIDAAALAADAAAEIADAIWDELVSGHTVFASFGQLVRANGFFSGRVNDIAAAAGDFDTDGFVEATAAHLDDAVMVFTTGVLAGQSNIISVYGGGALQNYAFDDAWTEAPADNDEFIVIPLTGAKRRTIATQTDGMAQADLREWLGVVPNALVSARVDASVGAMAADVVTAAAIANGAIDALTFAAGALDSAAHAADAFDKAFTRATSGWEASAPVKSLGAAVMKAVHRIRDNAGTLEIYRSDGLTIHASQTVTADAALNPVDELTGAV